MPVHHLLQHAAAIGNYKGGRGEKASWVVRPAHGDVASEVLPEEEDYEGDDAADESCPILFSSPEVFSKGSLNLGAYEPVVLVERGSRKSQFTRTG